MRLPFEFVLPTGATDQHELPVMLEGSHKQER